VKRIITLICFTFLIASPLILIRAPYGPHIDVVVPRSDEPVNINGNIGMWEWADAVQLDVTFRFYNDTKKEYVENRTGGISLKHDCASLYILIVITDPNEDENSWSAVYYDADRDGSLPYAHDGDDEKGIVHPGATMDIAVIDSNWENDTDLGGTKDVLGSSGFVSPDHLVYEYAHPLDSGDSLGNDVQVPPGSMATAFFMVGDPEVGEELYGTAYTEDWKYLYNLHITPCELPVGGTIIPLNPWLRATPFIALTILALIGYIKPVKSRRIPQ
jgi:hypothetical protein